MGMNEELEQAFDEFLEAQAWDTAQQALFDALRAAFLAGWAAAPCVRQSGRRTGAGKRASSHHPLPPLTQGSQALRGTGDWCAAETILCVRERGGRGAFRLWYKGPPAAFLSTFRRWKVDAVLRARRRGTFPRRAGAKRDAPSKLIANSLPQSPAATAPSSEGAKGLGCSLRDSCSEGAKGGLGWSLPGGFFI